MSRTYHAAQSLARLAIGTYGAYRMARTGRRVRLGTKRRGRSMTMTRTKKKKRRTKSGFNIRAQRRLLGTPRVANRCKTQAFNRADVAPGLLQSRTLNIGDDITAINAFSTASAGQVLARRSANRISIKGFKLCYYIHDRTPTDEHPNFYHVAVISRKRGTSTVPDGSNFLRGNGDETGIDLDTARSGMQLYCNGINLDRYVVLYHARHKLYGITTADDKPVNEQFCTVSRNVWIPVNRQFTFDAGGDANAITRCWVVSWMDKKSTPALDPIVDDAYELYTRVVTYYKDVIGS